MNISCITLLNVAYDSPKVMQNMVVTNENGTDIRNNCFHNAVSSRNNEDVQHLLKVAPTSVNQLNQRLQMPLQVRNTFKV